MMLARDISEKTRPLLFGLSPHLRALGRNDVETGVRPTRGTDSEELVCEVLAQCWLLSPVILLDKEATLAVAYR